MARLEANLTVKAGQDKEYLCSMGDNYRSIPRNSKGRQC